MTGPLPNFLIVGTMKSGTTSLANWLGAHPQAYVPPRKEIHFFDVDEYWALGVDWYREHFAGAAGEPAVGEGTPRYIFFGQAVERMAQTLPDAKLIVCLRDPIERARSHWTHAYHRSAVERRSFEQAMRDELALETHPEPEGLDGGYLARGHYAVQLERLERHYPRDRVHLVLFDDLRADPAAAFAATCEYLGIDPAFRPPRLGSRDNAAATYRPLTLWRHIQRHRMLGRVHPRLAWAIERTMKAPLPSHEPISDELWVQLAEHFEPHTSALERRLGRPIVGWTRPAAG